MYDMWKSKRFIWIMKKLLGIVVLGFSLVFSTIEAEAIIADLSVKVSNSLIIADQSIYITNNSILADETWYNAGKCSGFGDLTIYITTNSILADKSIYYTSNSILADKTVCFTDY